MDFKFKKGDIVEVRGYCCPVILDYVDNFLTKALNKAHWFTTTQDFIDGKVKTVPSDSFSEDDMVLYVDNEIGKIIQESDSIKYTMFVTLKEAKELYKKYNEYDSEL
jgi:hypothetical protein